MDEGRSDLTEDLNKESIKKFIEESQTSPVIEFSQQNAPKIFGGTIRTHVIMFIKKSSSEFKAKYNIFKNAAYRFQNEVRMLENVY